MLMAIFVAVKLYGEEIIFSSVVANPSAEPGLFEFFGESQTSLEAMTFYGHCLQMPHRVWLNFGHYWRYIPSVPPLALKTCRRMLLSRYILGFFRNIQFISFCQKQTVYCKPTSVCPFIGNHTSAHAYVRPTSIQMTLTNTWTCVRGSTCFPRLFLTASPRSSTFIPWPNTFSP